jgi:hypothetical protein
MKKKEVENLLNGCKYMKMISTTLFTCLALDTVQSSGACYVLDINRSDYILYVL